MKFQACHVSVIREPTSSLAACQYQARVSTSLNSMAGIVSSNMPSLQPQKHYRRPLHSFVRCRLEITVCMIDQPLVDYGPCYLWPLARLPMQKHVFLAQQPSETSFSVQNLSLNATTCTSINMVPQASGPPIRAQKPKGNSQKSKAKSQEPTRSGCLRLSTVRVKWFSRA